MESLHYLLMKTHTMLQRTISSKAAQLGLTPGQPKVLDFLLRYGENDQKTIASYCEIEQATAGSILLRMEKAGLIVRKQREGNRRSLFVSLTPSGTDAANRLMTIFREAEENAVRNLSPENVDALKQALSGMCETMKEGGFSL